MFSARFSSSFLPQFFVVILAVIDVGINIVQFCDCLAKCGILAYSKRDTFSKALPTVQEKIHHFFSVHLGECVLYTYV